MTVKKAVSIRMNHDTYNSLVEKAKKKNIKVSDLIRGILDSFISESDMIVIEVRKIKTPIKETKKEFEALLMTSSESKLNKEINENIMCIIVEKEEYSNVKVPPEQTAKQIECQMRYIKLHLDSSKTTTDEIIHLSSIREAIENKDYDKLKLLINYNTLRWKRIINGRIRPTREEATVLEERLKEKSAYYV